MGVASICAVRFHNVECLLTDSICEKEQRAFLHPVKVVDCIDTGDLHGAAGELGVLCFGFDDTISPACVFSTGLKCVLGQGMLIDSGSSSVLFVPSVVGGVCAGDAEVRRLLSAYRTYGDCRASDDLLEKMRRIIESVPVRNASEREAKQVLGAALSSITTAQDEPDSVVIDAFLLAADTAARCSRIDRVVYIK